MYRRSIDKKLQAALANTPVVLLHGARQSGKSTLAGQIATRRDGRYLTLDDPATASLARSDPSALVRGADAFTVIDEVQHAPELLPAIEQVLGGDGRAGRFLLTASANVDLLPRFTEPLGGRIGILALHPLSQGEMADNEPNLVDALFDGAAWQAGSVVLDRMAVCERILSGGFPEAVACAPVEPRDAWYRSHMASLLQRDVRDLANIEGLTDLPRLLALLAARASALMNMSEVSRAAGIAHSTLRRYLALLEATFIFQPLPAWSKDIGKRLVTSSKIHLLDSGLAAHLRGDVNASALARSPDLGPLLESFVVQEVRKLLGWSRDSATAYHFRTAAGQEVDLVLEAPGELVAGIEVRASSNVVRRDFSGLRALADIAGEKFVGGVVFYLGEQRLSFADNMWALPVAALWEPADATPALRSPAPADGSMSAFRGRKPAAEKLRISQSKLAALCAKFGVARLSLFGSAARNQLTPESDVDLMVEFSPGVLAPLLHIEAMQDEFSAAFGGRKVDIATPEILSDPARRDVIVPELKLIYAA